MESSGLSAPHLMTSICEMEQRGKRGNGVGSAAVDDDNVGGTVVSTTGTPFLNDLTSPFLPPKWPSFAPDEKEERDHHRPSWKEKLCSSFDPGRNPPESKRFEARRS